MGVTPFSPTAGLYYSFGRSEPHSETKFQSAWFSARPQDGPSARAGSFFERFDDLAVLGRMSGSRTDVGEADLLQKRAYVSITIVNAHKN